MTANTIRHLAIALSIVATSTTALRAQSVATDPSNTRGLFVSLHSGGIGMAYQGDRDGTGATGGLRLGYGFTERITGYLGLEAGRISEGDGFEGLPTGDRYGILLMDLGARFHFRRAARLVPFVDAAGTVPVLWFDNAADEEVTHTGPAASLGGGALWFASPRVALEAGASFTAGRLTERRIEGAKDDVRIGTSGVRVQVGVTLYPFR